MNKSMRLMKKEIEKRIFALGDRKLLRGILADCFRNERAKANQLLVAFDCGIISKLLETNNRDTFFEERLVQDVITGYGYDKFTAKWIVSVWSSCIDKAASEAWEEHNSQMLKSSIDKNPQKEVIKEVTDGILIPCGIGNSDHGFVVEGIVTASKCTDEFQSIFAVIYNYLQRNTRIDEQRDKPLYIEKKEEELFFNVDYKKVYRLMITMLLMIRNNYLKNNVLSFDFIGPKKELEMALGCLNYYIALFSRLIGIDNPREIRYQPNPRMVVSLDDNNKSTIRVKEYTGKRTQARDLWHAPRITYRITEQEKQDLEYILQEISDYKSFRPGQFEALQHLLCSRAHSVCIMPTGAGKSLLFYFCALLQPGATFVVAPTALLIYDQIENLKKYHRIDDAKHITYGGKEDFKNLVLKNRLYYLTPETFQNNDLLKEFILLNHKLQIGNVVLDEVHCISNWSHDFRPEYLMLSNYLNLYLDRCVILCFTATANYSVIKDVKNQIKIRNDRNIISPIDLGKDNLQYTFLSCCSLQEMIDEAYSFLKSNLIKGQKTLVFTKSVTTSEMLSEALGDIRDETQVYKKNATSAYRDFAAGNCKILIASDEIGIGINLSDIQNVLHFGLPISKGEYVQEIGRAGRNGGSATSKVLYLKCNSKNIDERLLHRNTEIADLLSIVQQSKTSNDYIETYRKIIGNIETQDNFNQLLLEIFEQVKTIEDHEYIDYPCEGIDKIKKCLFILFITGYVNNWSFSSARGDHITMLVGVRKQNQTLDKMRIKTKEYLNLLGGNKKSIYEVENAKSIEEILNAYVDWYYNHFIYHHKEQFLDMLSFFESHQSKGQDYYHSNKEINKRLASYFSLSMLDISQDEAKYAKLSLNALAEVVIQGVEYNTVSNIQRINQDVHNTKLDYFLFLIELVGDGKYDRSRMKRILDKLDAEIYYDLLESITLIYDKISEQNRLALFNDIYNFSHSQNKSFPVLFDMIYRVNKRDIIYYGVMAKLANQAFARSEKVVC